MSKVVMGIGFMILLVFLMSIYIGYTTLTDGAATLTSSVKHALAGQVMVPANAAAGGGYVNEGLNAEGLDLNLNSLTTAVANQISALWSGSHVATTTDDALTWTLPALVSQGFNVTGPLTIAPITESRSAPPTLFTMVAIPVAVHTLFGTWTGTIHRAVTLPLAGQTGPNTFVPYAQSWMTIYQSAWPAAIGGQYSSGWFNAAAIGPGSSPNANVPNGLWFASDQFTVTTPGTYTVWVVADDAAALYVDGQRVATASLDATGGQGSTVAVPLPAGTHVLNAEVTNNGSGSTAIVPDYSGGANPSALAVTVTAPNGQVVATTQHATGWTVNAYPTSPPPGAITTGTLP